MAKGVVGSMTASRSLLRVVKELVYDLVIEALSNVPMNTDVSYIHLPLGEDIKGNDIMNMTYRAFLEFESRRSIGKSRLTLVNS